MIININFDIISFIISILISCIVYYFLSIHDNSKIKKYKDF
jgi:hypothetical protein